MLAPGFKGLLVSSQTACDEGLKPCGDEYCIPVDQTCKSLCQAVIPSFPIQNDASSTLFVSARLLVDQQPVDSTLTNVLLELRRDMTPYAPAYPMGQCRSLSCRLHFFL